MFGQILLLIEILMIQFVQGLELIMRYFVASELGICNLLRKHYCWTSNSLWFEEIPNATDPTKTLFMLGGKDNILNSEVKSFESLIT